MPRAPALLVLVCSFPLVLMGQTSAPAPRPGMRVAARPTTQAATMPERKPITPEMVAAFGGPSVQEQEVRALREKLDTTSEEWKVIGPLLSKVFSAQKALTVDADTLEPPGHGGPQDWANGSFTGPGETARGDRSRFGGSQPPDASAAAAGAEIQLSPQQARIAESVTLGQALLDLKALLARKGTTDAQLHAEVAAVRDARIRARQDLTDATQELLPLLTDRQAALLEAMGYLE